MQNSRKCFNPSICNFNFTFPRPMILAFLSSPKKTSPPLYFSYLQNHSLWGVKWKDAPESINHASWSTCVLEQAKYTSPPSSEVVFAFVEGASLDLFPFSWALYLQSLLKCPSFPHFHHTFTGFPRDLDLPLDLYLPLDDLFMFLFWDRIHTDKAYPF